jgi:IclR family transcriptional regulator, KDG regulon repressor
VNLPTYNAPAVDGAARILKFLSRSRSRVSTLTEISEALDLSKSSALRILSSLRAHGLVEQDDDSKRYRLGLYAVVLGARAEEGLDSLSRTRPYMSEMAARSGQTAAMVQRIAPDRMMYVSKLTGEGPSTVHVSVGNRFPLFEVSYGKWVVAFADADERDAMVPPELPRMTPETRTDRDAYLEECANLGAHSVLTARNEYVAGVFTASCPVVGAHGGLEGVLVVLAFSESVDADAEQSIRDLLIDIASRCNAHVSTPTDRLPTPPAGRSIARHPV